MNKPLPTPEELDAFLDGYFALCERHGIHLEGGYDDELQLVEGSLKDYERDLLRSACQGALARWIEDREAWRREQAELEEVLSEALSPTQLALLSPAERGALYDRIRPLSRAERVAVLRSIAERRNRPRAPGGAVR